MDGRREALPRCGEGGHGGYLESVEPLVVGAAGAFTDASFMSAISTASSANARRSSTEAAEGCCCTAVDRPTDASSVTTVIKPNGARRLGMGGSIFAVVTNEKPVLKSSKKSTA